MDKLKALLDGKGLYHSNHDSFCYIKKGVVHIESYVTYEVDWVEFLTDFLLDYDHYKQEKDCNETSYAKERLAEINDSIR